MIDKALCIVVYHIGGCLSRQRRYNGDPQSRIAEKFCAVIDKWADVWYNNIFRYFTIFRKGGDTVNDLKKATDQKQRSRELDDFWDVERLLPERSLRRPAPRPRPTPAAVEVELEPRQMQSPTDAVSAAPLSATHYVPPHTADESDETPCDEYEPRTPLIHRVKVIAWRSNYRYFDQFSEDAVRIHKAPPPAEARREAFFSYFPQYAQMSRRQLDWYLVWRDYVRHGQYPDTDYAYVLLYMFELLNLPVENTEQATERRDLMARTWVAYRKVHRQLDHYMCEWLCDYCLIHHLQAPHAILAPALDDIIAVSRLKEFYLTAAMDGEEGLGTARMLLTHCCQYDYRKSKFAAGEHRELFDRTIPSAVAAMLPLLLGGEGKAPAITMLPSTTTRDAFTGALCSYRNKRKIEVTYTSFSRSHELRFLIGDMVKHVENRLRSWIGVRSRLSTMSLPIPLREALDAYLAPLASARVGASMAHKNEPRPAYEALYDLPKSELSLGGADAIEAASWETTRRLTEALGGDAEDIPTPIPAESPRVVPPDPPLQDATFDSATPLADALGELTEFVRLALREDGAGQRAFAARIHRMPDAIADAINTVTAEGEICDMILEEDGGTYRVIEDYREQVKALLGAE